MDTFFLEQGLIFKEATELEKVDDSELHPDEPYKSKYKARNLFNDVLANLKKVDPQKLGLETLKAAEATVLLFLGANAYETEEVSDGENHLKNCLDLVGGADGDVQPKHVSIVIHALNHLGIVWNLRKDHEKSLEFFSRAKDLHEAFLAKNPESAPDFLTQCFDQDLTSNLDADIEAKKRYEFDRLFTHTLYFLAQCYERLGRKAESALHCHRTLSRQLDSVDFQVLDWSRNCAILSQYYVGVGQMRMAVHCLAAATVMFGRHEFKAEKEEAEEERDRTRAEMERCWGAYALSLLRYSKEYHAKLKDDDRDPDVSDELLDRIAFDAVTDISESPLAFMALDMAKMADQESKVAVDVAKEYDQAKALFLFGTKCLDNAKSFYTLNDFCTDHVSILQSGSQFYKLLADLETDVGNKCKMHKRRIDSLSEVLKELNPTYYLVIMRQLQFELGECYSTMMDLKYSAIEGGEKKADPKAVKKINMLTKGSINHFQDFLQSFHAKCDDGQLRMPETLEDMNVRPVLLSYFHIARLYPKFVEAEARKRVVNLEVSKGFYQKLIDYVDSHPNVKEAVQSEYDIAVELVPMMDIKMRSMRAANT